MQSNIKSKSNNNNISILAKDIVWSSGSDVLKFYRELVKKKEILRDSTIAKGTRTTIEEACENKDFRDLVEKVQDQFKWYHESFGKEHWVLYDFNEYEEKTVLGEESIEFDCLHAKQSALQGIHIPVNCSSCVCMFLNCRFPNNYSFGKEFNTKKVTDMSSMFRNCKFGNGFSLSDNFYTKNVEHMYRIFENAYYTRNFHYGANFKELPKDISLESFCNPRTFPMATASRVVGVNWT